LLPRPVVVGTAKVGIVVNGAVELPFVDIQSFTEQGVIGNGEISFFASAAGTAKVAKSAYVALSYAGYTVEGTAEMEREADGTVEIDQFTIAAIALSNNLCSSRLEHVR
jgi:hypothetical protein